MSTCCSSSAELLPVVSYAGPPCGPQVLHSVFSCGHSEQSGNYFQGRSINNKFNYLLARSLAATIDNTDHREGLRWLFIDEIFCRQLCDSTHGAVDRVDSDGCNECWCSVCVLWLITALLPPATSRQPPANLRISPPMLLLIEDTSLKSHFSRRPKHTKLNL